MNQKKKMKLQWNLKKKIKVKDGFYIKQLKTCRKSEHINNSGRNWKKITNALEPPFKEKEIIIQGLNRFTGEYSQTFQELDNSLINPKDFSIIYWTDRDTQ